MDGIKKSFIGSGIRYDLLFPEWNRNAGRENAAKKAATMSQMPAKAPLFAIGRAMSSEAMEPAYPMVNPHPETRPWYATGAIPGRKEL